MESKDISIAARMRSASRAWSRWTEIGTFAERAAEAARSTTVERPWARMMDQGKSWMMAGDSLRSAARTVARMPSRL